jgi:hypothetical protein
MIDMLGLVVEASKKESKENSKRLAVPHQCSQPFHAICLWVSIETDH